MIVDEVLTGWLRQQLSDVTVSSVAPADLEQHLPWVVVRSGGGGDLDGLWLRGVEVDVDVFAAPDPGAAPNGGWHAVSLLAGRVDDAFRNFTPAAYAGTSLTLVTTRQNFLKVPDPNTSLRQLSAAYLCSAQ